ncbi:MAG: phosphoenolpyruvate carboxykinase (ATP) [Fimbriimonadaceae bacterium]|nr:MAG: phosphoenolpyruvate carboxykinase (ATP) [Fimbriimonadaceae bacterium]
MSATSVAPATFALETAKKVYWNLTVPELVELALARGEGILADNGALVTKTGKYTGRTPKDKHTVRDGSTEDTVWWDNNADMSPETFAMLLVKANGAMASKELFVIDTYGGADPAHRIKVRFIVENAYHALFIKQLLIRPTREELKDFQPEWTVVDLCRETWERDGRDAVIALNMSAKTVLIMGTFYAGEMKKSVFTIMNYLLPLKGVMSMHCSANIGANGDTALFFGLSGTGKTTLSADPDRRLIGDDEHGWTDTGVFNVEGGCYAKCIKLSREGEPQIWDAIKFGSVLENVVMDDSRRPDYDDASLTENTRCAYPLDHIEGAVSPSVGGHPKNIFFLTCDAYGVLPPISRLSKEQAMFHFLNGYTAKVAGTEAGVTEPQLAFSTCFGAPFLPLHPSVYAKLLGEKLEKHGSQVWLVNTGWTGGPYGVGSRMKLAHTRAMIHAALEGKLAQFATEAVFGLQIPVSCPNVPDEVLDPRNTWADKAAYDAKANELKAKFEANFEKFKG